MSSVVLSRDILAIRCINKYVFVAIGNCINVHEIASGEIVDKLRVFESDNVHGVVEGPAKQLFIFGGKNLAICELIIKDDTARLCLRSVRRFDDWIITLGCPRRTNAILSILFAHNNLRFYDTACEKIEIVRCGEKCILYGGFVLPVSNEETIVFSGTVFQEILIWRAKKNREDKNDAIILHRLKGHKGVIFSVVYDPSSRVISSTSDDRTVRLWKVENKSLRDSNEINWDNCDIGLKITMYGHTARVWRSVVRNNKIISVGEDSLMCVWSLDGRLLNKLEIHNGAEIWSIDVSEDNKNIFSGGADGAVNVWPFEIPPDARTNLVYSSDEGKIPKFVLYTKNGCIIIFFDGGRLIGYNQESKSIVASLNIPRYSSYCVMQISPDRTKIALGSKDGYLEIYEEISNEGVWKLNKIFERKVTESKIFAFHWLSDEKIIVCGEKGRLRIIDENSEAENPGSTFILPSSRERWTTAAIIHKNHLICGDRAGSVYTFDLIHRHHESLPTRVFPKIHGRLGVQSFSTVANKILSTGRDGTLRFYEINEETKNVRALHLKKMPMDWVCRILKTRNDLYILGFKEVELIIYSTKLKRIVERFVCGGGHRSWDYELTNEKVKFLFIRDKRVYEMESNLRNIEPPILEGHHTKEIYNVKPIETSSSHNIFVSAGEDCSLRLTSIVENAESNIEKYRLNNLDTYDGHISSVKALAILNLKNDGKSTKNLVISGGGRAQLKIWEISVTIDKEILTNDDVTCTELLSYMLRGTDKDRKKKWQTIEPDFFVDPETRFMDTSVQFYAKDSNLVVIFLACSDGFLRTLLYDIASNTLRSSNIVNYCNRCTLKVNAFLHERETILMAMTTDGTVSFWQMTKDIESLVLSLEKKETRMTEMNEPFSKIKIHQCGINSFDFRKIDDSRWLLLTGGDDNLLSLTAVEISSKNNEYSAAELTSWNSSSIHCAQITGAKFLDEKHLLSTGIDQLVVFYSYTYIEGVLSVSRLEETITLVPDVQGVALCGRTIENDGTLICIYGKGLEVLKHHGEK